MRLLHLARLSQDQGERQTGIESSDLQVRNWAANNGHVIIHTAADKKSGTIQPWNRPHAKPWLTDPEKISQYDGVVAYRFDRLSRGDDASTSEIEKWARDNGKILLTEDGLQYPCEGVEGIRWDVTKRIAHEEWLKTSERYTRMQKHLRDSGYLVGRPCFGFQVIALDNHKTLQPHPVNAEFVRQAIARYLEGESLRSVCSWLDSQGALPPSGGKWSPVSLSQVFHNESLIGRRKNENGKTILKFPAVIDKATWAKLQDKLGEKASRKGVAPKATALLTSIATCYKCGGPMYRQTSTRKRKDESKAQYVYYRCHGDDRNPSQCGFMVSQPKLDAAVNEFFARWDDAEVTEIVLIPGEGYEDEISDVERDLRELDFDAPDFAERQAALLAERARLKNLPARPGRTELRGIGLSHAQYWASLTDAQRRSWLLEHKAQIRVFPEISGSPFTMDGWALELP